MADRELRTTDDDRARSRSERPRIVTGAERLARDGFAALAGKSVGLITNQTGLVHGAPLARIMSEAGTFELAALFSPEHGVSGLIEAGETVPGARDGRTGIPVYSLYGQSKKPTREMLEGIDILVFDIQDVGVRFYTYISTMGLAMQAAAEAGVAFMVLDRPNPLGGTYVSGFVAEEQHRSFVGRFAIPIAHGLTVGELARLIQGEGLLPGIEALDLVVVPMEGWERWMRWPDLGLPWIATSPNIDTPDAALLYAGTGFFEATSLSEGRGTQKPFRLVGADWIEASMLAGLLNRRGLPGVVFEATRVRPRSIAGKARHPRFEDHEIGAVELVVTDPSSLAPVEIGVELLQAFRAHARERARPDPIDNPDWLAKLAGTERLRELLNQGMPAEKIIGSWQDEVAKFKAARQPYLIYD